MAVLARRTLNMLLLLLFRVGLCLAQRLADRATVVNDVSGVKARYDYVVVGGGTSGLTVANRLTEDPSGTVSGTKLRFLTVFSLTTFV